MGYQKPLNGLTLISSKENKDEIWKSTANLSGLRLTPHMLIGKPMPHYRDLQWILTYKNKSNNMITGMQMPTYRDL